MGSNLKQLDDKIDSAVAALNSGGVIAYPTEYCFGLGCNPEDQIAVQRLLKIKQRQPDQGVILIASSTAQVEEYVDLQASPHLSNILDSWPGPHTWVLPARKKASPWVKGKHAGVAVRVTNNSICKALCSQYGGAIVSTSANRHGQPALLDAKSVVAEMGDELSYVIDELVGGAQSPSSIKDGLTGQQLR